MIRIFNKQLVAVENGAAKNVATVYCNSSDTKPTSDLANGSTLVEVDTGKNYLFNEATSSWVEVSGGGGSVNNNTKETYTGTMNTLGDTLVSICETHYTSGLEIDKHYMADDIKSGNMSSTLVLDLSLLGGNPNYLLTSISEPLGNNFDYINFQIDQSSNNVEGITIICDVRYNGELTEPVWSSIVVGEAYMNGEVMEISSYFANIPYTLTIYWHEMPTA